MNNYTNINRKGYSPVSFDKKFLKIKTNLRVAGDTV